MKIDTPKCHIFMMEIRAYRKNFQLALHTVTWGKAAIHLPGPCKDKGFSGLGLDMKYFQVHQTSVCSVFQMSSACTMQAL